MLDLNYWSDFSDSDSDSECGEDAVEQQVKVAKCASRNAPLRNQELDYIQCHVKEEPKDLKDVQKLQRGPIHILRAQVALCERQTRRYSFVSLDLNPCEIQEIVVKDIPRTVSDHEFQSQCDKVLSKKFCTRREEIQSQRYILRIMLQPDSIKKSCSLAYILVKNRQIAEVLLQHFSSCGMVLALDDGELVYRRLQAQHTFPSASARIVQKHLPIETQKRELVSLIATGIPDFVVAADFSRFLMDQTGVEISNISAKCGKTENRSTLYINTNLSDAFKFMDMVNGRMVQFDGQAGTQQFFVFFSLDTRNLSTLWKGYREDYWPNSSVNIIGFPVEMSDNAIVSFVQQHAPLEWWHVPEPIKGSKSINVLCTDVHNGATNLRNTLANHKIESRSLLGQTCKVQLRVVQK